MEYARVVIRDAHNIMFLREYRTLGDCGLGVYRVPADDEQLHDTSAWRTMLTTGVLPSGWRVRSKVPRAEALDGLAWFARTSGRHVSGILVCINPDVVRGKHRVEVSCGMDN
jgi:hypothetical protein